MITAAELAAALGLPAPTAEQAEIIEAPLTPGLVVAGAGSGKTETMAARVVYLVATGAGAAGTGARADLHPQGCGRARPADPPPATDAGCERPAAALATAGGGDPEVATYHSFGGRLIADFGPLAGVEPASRVLTATGAWQLARGVVGRWDGDLNTDLGPDQVTERLLAISGALADHLTDAGALAAVLDMLLERLRSAPPAPRQRGPLHSGLADHVKRLQDRQWILPLVQAFVEAKRERGVIDFADQMQIAASLVLGHPRIGIGAAREVPGRVARRVPGHRSCAADDPARLVRRWGDRRFHRPPGDGGRRPGAVDLLLAWGVGVEPAAVRHGLPTGVRCPGGDPLAADQFPKPTVGTDPGQRTVHLDPHRAGRPGGGRRTAVGPRRTAGRRPVRPVLDGRRRGRLARQSIADRWKSAMDGSGSAAPTTAVLLRRRSDMAATAAALRAAGLPVEVVGLGGLLDEPEIADLVATLRVLVDPTAGSAAIRLLTGARWRLGAADLEALAQRSRNLVRLARVPVDARPDSVGTQCGSRWRRRCPARTSTPGAWSTPSPTRARPNDYSAEGYRRLTRFAAQLRRLSGRLGQPLPDLIADLERATGLDIEVQLGSPAGRAHLDAFAEVVAEVAATGAGPTELLGYLDAAAEREDGLTPGEVPAQHPAGCRC